MPEQQSRYCGSVGIEGIEDLIGDFKRLLTQSYL